MEKDPVEEHVPTESAKLAEIETQSKIDEKTTNQQSQDEIPNETPKDEVPNEQPHDELPNEQSKEPSVKVELEGEPETEPLLPGSDMTETSSAQVESSPAKVAQREEDTTPITKTDEPIVEPTESNMAVSPKTSIPTEQDQIEEDVEARPAPINRELSTIDSIIESVIKQHDQPITEPETNIKAGEEIKLEPEVRPQPVQHPVIQPPVFVSEPVVKSTILQPVSNLPAGDSNAKKSAKLRKPKTTTKKSNSLLISHLLEQQDLLKKQLEQKQIEEAEKLKNNSYFVEQIWEEHCYTPHMPWLASGTSEPICKEEQLQPPAVMSTPVESDTFVAISSSVVEVSTQDAPPSPQPPQPAPPPPPPPCQPSPEPVIKTESLESSSTRPELPTVESPSPVKQLPVVEPPATKPPKLSNLPRELMSLLPPPVSVKHDLISSKKKQQQLPLPPLPTKSKFDELVELAAQRFKKRSQLEEDQIRNVYLTNGIDREDMYYLKRTFEKMIEDQTDNDNENDEFARMVKKLKWVNHCETVAPTGASSARTRVYVPKSKEGYQPATITANSAGRLSSCSYLNKSAYISPISLSLQVNSAYLHSNEPHELDFNNNNNAGVGNSGLNGSSVSGCDGGDPNHGETGSMGGVSSGGSSGGGLGSNGGASSMGAGGASGGVSGGGGCSVSASSSLSSVCNHGAAREARSMQRRLMASNDIHEVFKFSQLKLRKKPLKFSKSDIHEWGLFALEQIGAEEFVIEYVGEVIRQSVADHREKCYNAQGIGCSYMFRIDQDTIVDATTCGNLSRFINHSCDVSIFKIIIIKPNSILKIYYFLQLFKGHILIKN